MCGGGGSQTTTQTTTIPPEVLARYNAVNARAENVAGTPFQQYSNDPNAFVAPLTQTQQAGIAGTNAYASAAQPYYGAATNQLQQAQSAGSAGLSGAYMPLQQGMATGQDLGQQAYSGYAALPGAYQPSFAQAQQNLQQGLGAGQAGLGAATQYALAGSQAVSPQQFSGQAINQYMSPFLSNVVGQTMAAQAQQNAQQRNALTGDAIRAGAFGGDRAGIAQANLAYQQNLANQQTIANLYNQGYGQALGAFQQQQGVNLAADQANRAALQQTGQALGNIGQQAYGMGAGAAGQQSALGQALAGIYGQQAQGLAGLGQQQFGQGLSASQQQAALAQAGYGMGAGTAQALAGLGQGVQAAGLQGAQAQLGAGQMQQQTEQAGKSALYNQFLQEKSYPFQVAQFLANIAMGTGSLSGSTTTTQQPSAFFSDEKLKDNIEPIGKTFDGQDIVKFSYKGSPQKQIGLLAQDVEKHHPEAVGLAGGYKTVDYDAATKEAAEKGRPHKVGGGGLGGSGAFDQDAIRQILANQAGMYSGLYEQPGTPRGAQGLPHGGKSFVPQANLAVGRISPHSAPNRPQSAMSDIQQAASLGSTATGLYKGAKELYKDATAPKQNAAPADQSKGVAGGQAAPAADKPAAGAAPISYESGTEGFFIPGEGAGDVAKTGVDAAKQVAETAQDIPLDDLADLATSVFANGGRVGKASGGATDDDAEKDIGAPEGMYKPTSGIDIPNETKKNELMKPDKAPSSGSKGSGAMDAIGTGLKIAGTIASLAGLSDKRAKENIKKIGKTNDGLDIVKFNYKGSKQTLIGLIAQDVEKVKPDAVGVAGGLKFVDYDKATKGAERAKKAGGGSTSDVKEGLAPLVEQPIEEEKKGVVPVRVASVEATKSDAAPVGVAPAAKKEQPNIDDLYEKQILRIESNSRHRDDKGNVIRSPKGATGIAQVMPGTGPEAAKMAGLPWDPDRYVNDEKYNKELGRAYYKNMYAKYQDPVVAAAAYNAGPGNVDKAMAKAQQTGRPYTDFLPAETQKYVVNFANGTRKINEVAEGKLAAAAIPGVAGASRGSTDAASAPFSNMMGGLLPEGTSQKTKDIVTSENFWVPLLAGVGSMLASPSIKLPGAIGAGLVGGTAAYTGLQKQQADISQTLASTEKVNADIVRESIFTDSGGRTWIRYVNPNGGYQVMSIAEYVDLPDNAKPKLDPRVEKIVQEAAGTELSKRKPATTDKLGPATPAGAPAPVETAPLPELKTEEPAQAKPEASTSYIQLPNELQQKYAAKGRQLFAGGNQMAGDQPDVFTPQMKVAQGANNQRGQIAELATALAASPRSKSLLASGEAQKTLQPLALTLNGYAAAIGIPAVLDPKDVANAEAVQKAVNMLKTAAAKEGNQNAFAALEQFGATLPSKLNSPQGQAQLLAQVYYNNQREIDKQNFYSQILKAAGGDKGQYAQYAMRSGLEADADFNKEYSQAKYAKEIKSLERMFNEGPKGMTSNGRPVTWIEFLNKEGGSLTAKERRQIEDQFGKGILRYFGVQ